MTTETHPMRYVSSALRVLSRCPERNEHEAYELEKGFSRGPVDWGPVDRCGNPREGPGTSQGLRRLRPARASDRTGRKRSSTRGIEQGHNLRSWPQGP